METEALIDEVLDSDEGTACELDVRGSPPGPTIRCLYSAPYAAVDAITGRHVNTSPEIHCKRSDVSSVTPEQTVVRVEGVEYIAERSERIEGRGDLWRRLVLRVAPGV